MTRWHAKQTTILHKETQQGTALPNNSERTDDETEALVKLLTGQVLNQASYMTQFASLLRQVAQSNSGTPVMVEASSFALWAMASHIMNMCGQLRTLIFTSAPSVKITPSEHTLLDAIDDIQRLVDEIMNDCFGFGWNG